MSVPVDEAAFAEALELLGSSRLASLAAKFKEELLDRFSGHDDLRRLQSDAHKTVPSAGALGLEALSETAATLEEACFDGCGLEDALRLCIAARNEAVGLLAGRYQHPEQSEHRSAGE